MKNDFISLLLSLLGLIISMIFLIKNCKTGNDIATPILSGITFLAEIINIFSKYFINLKLFINWLICFIRKDKIRVSMSYIYKIEIDDDKYLLVKNSHQENTYQFVGGKYKYYDSAVDCLKKLEMEPDDKLKQTQKRKRDIAFYIPAKNFYKFLKWFESGKDREIDHYREFEEELLTTTKTESPVIRNRDIFNRIEFKKDMVLTTGIRRSPSESGWNCIEYNQYDVLEPLLTDTQKNELRKIQENDYIKITDRKRIIHKGHADGEDKKPYSISDHTAWCLLGKLNKRG